MAKYIIDIPDKAIDFMGGRDHFSMFVEPECKVGDCKHYALRISKEDIEPYTKPDRKAIEDEVWEFVRIITDMTEKQRIECFGGASCNLDKYWTYQDAKTKYEAWKKKEEEIRVGDEVVPLYAQYDTMVVTKLWVSECHDEWVDTIASDGKFFSFLKTSIKKTGRHFDDVEELLKKMKG